MNKEIKTSWTWQYILLAITVSFLSGLIGYLLKYWLEPNECPDYFLLNRPYLEPKLLLLAGIDKRPVFLIRNNGKLPAHNLSLAVVRSEVKYGEGTLTIPKELAPNGEMEFVPPFLRDKTEMDGNTTLYIMYTAEVSGKKKCFRDNFDFVINTRPERPSSHSYRIANREEISTSEKELQDLLSIGPTLDGDIGTFVFMYSPPTNIPENPFYIFETRTKSLAYDPSLKMLAYKTFSPEKITIWTSILSQNINGWHLWGLSWSNNEASISIDGQDLGRLAQPTVTDYENNSSQQRDRD